MSNCDSSRKKKEKQKKERKGNTEIVTDRKKGFFFERGLWQTGAILHRNGGTTIFLLTFPFFFISPRCDFDWLCDDRIYEASPNVDEYWMPWNIFRAIFFNNTRRLILIGCCRQRTFPSALRLKISLDGKRTMSSFDERFNCSNKKKKKKTLQFPRFFLFGSRQSYISLHLLPCCTLCISMPFE